MRRFLFYRNAATDNANGEIDAQCSTDYLSVIRLIFTTKLRKQCCIDNYFQIPNGVGGGVGAGAATALSAGGVVILGAERFCGRTFNSIGGAAAAQTICSK